MMCKDQSSGARELKIAEYRSIKEQRKWIRDLETRFEQLNSYYIISQLGILWSISCSSATLRKYMWIPFCLLSLVSILFGVLITSTVSELLRIRYEDNGSFMEQLIIIKIQKQADGGGRVRSGDYSSQNKRLYRRYAYVSVIFSALLAFTGVVFSACHAILRDGDRIIGSY